MNQSKKTVYFQDYMPENVCFGCGINNEEGLKIKSFWVDQESICEWVPEEKYHGWSDLLNGGIIATLIDCHCMGTAMADAYKRESRQLDSEPIYRYATGTLQIKYLLPTPTLYPIRLVAKVVEVKNKKTTLHCEMFSQGQKTVEADVIAIRVYDSSSDHGQNPFKS